MPVEIETLDAEGYPTEEYLKLIMEWKDDAPVMDFIKYYLENGWYYGDWGFKLHRPYRGIRKLELHTGGWSGNEEIIRAILGNVYLTHWKMKYVLWRTGGHYYFEINTK